MHGRYSVCQALQTKEKSNDHLVFHKCSHLPDKWNAAPDVQGNDKYYQQLYVNVEALIYNMFTKCGNFQACQ